LGIFSFIMSETNNTHQTVLGRLQFLSNAITKALENTDKVLETVLRDAVTWQQSGGATCPTILTQEGLISIQNIQHNLSSMAGYYVNHIENYKKSVGLSDVVETAVAPADKAAPVDVEAAVARLRQATHDAAIASRRPPPVEALDITPPVDLTPEPPLRSIPPVAPAAMPDGTPTVSGARAATAAHLAEIAALAGTPADQLAARREQLASLDDEPMGHSSGGMSMRSPVDLGSQSTSAGLPPVKAVGELQVARPPQNSVDILLGQASPLLDIFAAGPWLPDGRGIITVGSAGFQWYKRANPLQLAAEDRSTLPAGFFGGDSVPACVVLRLQSTIVIWSFTLEPDSIAIYMAGLSDRDPQHVRWFSPTHLSATYSARLLKELTDFASGAQAAK
jgi:hypothetical protein